MSESDRLRKIDPHEHEVFTPEKWEQVQKSLEEFSQDIQWTEFMREELLQEFPEQ